MRIAKEIKPDIYYQEGPITVRRTQVEDIAKLAVNLRESDHTQISASHHQDSKMALKDSVDHSIFCLTIQSADEIMGIFGIVPENITGNKATIWFVASKNLPLQNSFICSPEIEEPKPMGLDGELYHYFSFERK